MLSVLGQKKEQKKHKQAIMLGPVFKTIIWWYIYLHEWLIFMVNVGKYTIYGSYTWILWVGLKFKCTLPETNIT